MGLSLAKDNVRVKFVATDGDALGTRGIQAGMPAIATERQSYMTHIGETQFRHIMKTPFSTGCFPKTLRSFKQRTRRCLEKT